MSAWLFRLCNQKCTQTLGRCSRNVQCPSALCKWCQRCSHKWWPSLASLQHVMANRRKWPMDLSIGSPSGTLSQATETAPNSSTNHGCTMFEHVKPYHPRHPRHPKLDSDSTCSLPNFFERRFAKRFPSPAKRFKEPKTACSNQSGPNLKLCYPRLKSASNARLQ